MDAKKLKQQLHSLHRMDFPALLNEMVDEMTASGTQRMAVSFNDEGKPVAGVVLLAAPDISPFLEALETVEQSASAAPSPEMLKGGQQLEVTTKMTAAGMVEWDKQMNAGQRHWPEMLEAVFKAMASAAPSQTEGYQHG